MIDGHIDVPKVRKENIKLHSNCDMCEPGHPLVASSPIGTYCRGCWEKIIKIANECIAAINEG